MPKKLLLADDSVVIQKLVGLSFANEDVEIVATDNGDDALAKAAEEAPDVVLADVVMPGKSGYEVCEAIKQDPALAHVPVLLLTGTFEAFDESRAAAVGADGQITKPFEAQALVERVTQVMNAPPPAAPEPEAEAAPPAAAAPAVAGSPPGTDVSDDFFAADGPDLSASGSGAAAEGAPSVDVTPRMPADGLPDTSISQLFGDPGDGAADSLEVGSGPLTLGEAVAPPTTPDPDATVVSLPDAGPAKDAADPLAEFGDDLGLSGPPPVREPMPSAAEDLDAALDEPAADDSPTILVAADDVNAKTSPNFDPLAETAEGAALEDLTIHVPTSAIDSDRATAPSPAAIESDPMAHPATGPEATVVADLDASLDISSPSVQATSLVEEPPMPSAPSETPPPVPPPAAEPPSPPPPESIDLGPSSKAPDDLDFAFDVSEQVSVNEISADPLSDSFSSLDDISESQILGDPAASGSSEAAEDLVVGYDVSQSDLATTPPPPDPAADSSPALELSQPIIDTGMRAAAEDEAGASSPAVETELSPAIAFGLTTGGEASPSAPEAPEPSVVATPASGEERVADLSPMVEQRIQETLEKVAWEAFSDLSESIVKQVLGRVEQIAWEVIPQMAETLVREEIRKMKGESD